MASRAVENFYEPGPPAENRSSRVLIHAPFGRDGALLCDVLARAGIEALACGSLDQTCADFHAGAAALLVGDEALNEGGMERLRRMLSQQPPWSDIPLFVMTRRADSTARYHFLKRFDVLGNVSLLDRPLRAETIVSALQMALRARHRQYDIRDYVEAERRHSAALACANAELRRANEDLNQFAFSASHDLQEPLRMVAVFTQMLEREYGEGLGEQAAQYMRYTLQGARRMEELLKDLLSYVRALNAGDEGVSRTDADAVLDQTIANLDGVIQATGAVVERGRLPVVMIQRIHLLQLFQNIVGNALKYRAEDQPRICVWAQPVSAEQNNPVWRFNIRDNGIGIEPRFAQHIFGVFKRLHSGHDKYPGTGIGLAICQKIVERYGGRIWVESEGTGKGSLFSFTLPAAEARKSGPGGG